LDRDSILVASTLQGDMQAFEQLIEAYQKRLFSFLYKLTLSREDAEEILQEAFIRAYNYLYRYDSRFNFSSWLFKITLNTYKTEYKKKKIERRTELLDMLPEDLRSNEGYPEDAFERKEDIITLINSLNALKEEQRIALLLRFIKGYSYKEAGNIMGISPEAVKMKVQRAKEILVKRLEGRKRGGLI